MEQLCSQGDRQQRGKKIEPNVQQEAVKRFQLSRLSPLQQLASCWWRRRLSAPSTVLVAVVAADVGVTRAKAAGTGGEAGLTADLGTNGEWRRPLLALLQLFAV